MTGIVDTNVWCGHWPFRRLEPNTPVDLKAHLSAGGIRQAWVSAVDAVLYPDPMLANVPLLEQVAGDDFYVPMAVIDVTLGTWRRDLERCLEVWGCGGVKVTPSYHGCPLSDRRMEELAEVARQADVPVCVQMRIMDERAHHPLMRVPGVPARDVAEVAAAHPGTPFLACGAYRMDLEALAEAPNVWAEVSMVESSLSLRTAVERMGADRVVFGSHSPFQYLAAMLAKLSVDPQDVTPEEVAAIREFNAATLLGH